MVSIDYESYKIGDDKDTITFNLSKSGTVRNNDTIEGVDSGNVNNSTGNQLASFSYYGSNNLNINYNSIDNGNVASVSTAVNDFIKELEKNPSLVSTANTSEI